MRRILARYRSALALFKSVFAYRSTWLALLRAAARHRPLPFGLLSAIAAVAFAFVGLQLSVLALAVIAIAHAPSLASKAGGFAAQAACSLVFGSGVFVSALFRAVILGGRATVAISNREVP